MTKVALDVLKARIADAYDYDYIIDVLDISVEMILDAFEDRLEDRRHLFEELEEIDIDFEEDTWH